MLCLPCWQSLQFGIFRLVDTSLKSCCTVQGSPWGLPGSRVRAEAAQIHLSMETASSSPRSRDESSPAISPWGAAPAEWTYPLQLVHHLFLTPGEDGPAASIYRSASLRIREHPTPSGAKDAGMGTWSWAGAAHSSPHVPFLQYSLSKHFHCNSLRRAGKDSKDDPHACTVSLCFMLCCHSYFVILHTSVLLQLIKPSERLFSFSPQHRKYLVFKESDKMIGYWNWRGGRHSFLFHSVTQFLAAPFAH